MNILLTNDDGIHAPGILALYKALKKHASITIAAPDSQRSSVGHGITLSNPIWYKKVKFDGQVEGYAISGTPADCVKFAMRVLLKKQPDLIISGINLGPNDGCSVFYSGTVAGAREGALMGIPAIAVSLGTFVDPDFRYAASISRRIVQFVKKQQIPKGSFLNVNVPALPSAKIKGIRVATQGLVPIHGSFDRRHDPAGREYYWMTGELPEIKTDDGSDTYALAKGYVTVVPIQCDLTNYSFLNVLQTVKISA